MEKMKIPIELISLPNWVCWGAPGDEKVKCPYNPKGDYRAAAGKPESWVDFETALKAVMDGKYKGVGFEFNGCGIVGVDFDHCLDPQTGKANAWAQAWVDRLNSYTEISPSGDGLHVFCKGELSGPAVKRPEAEIYDRARYFTVTGKPYGDVRPMREGGDALVALYDELRGPQDSLQERPARPSNGLVPAKPGPDYLQTGLEKDSVLGSLYRGDRPNGNESADDMALLNKLAYWCNCDQEAMWAAFLSSGHYQGKDEAHKKKARRLDYRRSSLNKAIKGCTRTAAEDDAEYMERKAAQAAPAGRTGSLDKQPPAGQFAPFEPFEAEGLQPLPEFPAGALPPVIGEYAKAIAESIQVPLDMPAVGLLVAFSLAVQGAFCIEPKPGWREPLNVYAVVVAPPSDRKSPVLQEITRTLYRFAKSENERRRPEIDEYQVKKQLLEKELSAMIDRASKPTRGKSGQDRAIITEQEIQDKRRELSELKEVKPFRLLADDVTPEALTSLLSGNGGRLGVMSAEGGLFRILSGLYSKQEANIDTFLKAYSGDCVMVDRKGRASEVIESPALTMLLMIQPQVLKDIMENREFMGRGLLARYLYCIPRSLVGRRAYNTPHIAPSVANACQARLVELLGRQAQEIEDPGIITLGEDAAAMSESFFYALEPRLVDDLEDVEAWAGKFHGQVMRIAGILHCAENGLDAAVEPLRGSTMQKAITIGEYFLAHAQAAFRLMGATEPQAVRDGKYILKRIQAAGRPEISKRDLAQVCRGRFPTVEAFEPGLNELVRRGYIRIEKPTGGRGRPAEKVVLNPISISQNTQNTQK